MYKEMKQMGGTTGGFGLSTKTDVKLDIKKMESLLESKGKKAVEDLLKYVDIWNTIFEDSTRLSVYRGAIEQGLSKDRAAFLSKEASINFNRMGKGGPVINSLYMFSNASIRGSVKMMQSMKDPKALGITLLMVATAVATIYEWNDSVDEDWRDKVTKWDKLNGLPLVIPTKDGVKYITIPVSWGIKPIKVMADYAYDSLSGQDFITKNFINDTMTSIIDAYNPVGGTDIYSAMTPTILDMPIELARNTSWSGNKIKPDFDPNAPEDIKYFNSLSEKKSGEVAISISEALRDYGQVAISPADINYAYEQMVGGAGRFITKTLNTIIGAFTEPVGLNEYPFISRFYRERDEEQVGQGTGKIESIKDLLEKQSRDRFYIQKEAEKNYEELLKMEVDQRINRIKEIAKEDKDMYDRIKKIGVDKAKGLTYTDRLIKQLGVESGERAMYIYQELKKIDKEERAKWIKELMQKGVITDNVLDQLKQLYIKQ
jgi:hypothetical protein